MLWFPDYDSIEDTFVPTETKLVDAKKVLEIMKSEQFQKAWKILQDSCDDGSDHD